MGADMEELEVFIAEKRDSREYRRALAVKMALKGYDMMLFVIFSV